MKISGKPFRELTLEKAIKIGAAIGQIAGRRSLVVSGRDASRVSRMLKRAITAGVMSAGADVMDFHESTTGEVSFAIKRFGARLGFMVTVNPAGEDVFIKVYKTPGYEVLGDEIREIVDSIEKRVEEPVEVGWIYYAEYMHRLYISALLTFVKSDQISSRRPTTVVAPSIQPLDVIFTELSSSLGLDQAIIATQISNLKNPAIDIANNVSRVVDALKADIGILLAHDGSSIATYSRELGLLLPEELALVLVERYSPGSRVVVLNPVSRNLIDRAIEQGYDVFTTSSESDYSRVIKRDRPALTYTWRGDFTTPVFNMGPDGVLHYVQLLEVLSEHGVGILEKIREWRKNLRSEVLAVEEAISLCREIGVELTPWGCRIVRDNTLYSIIYYPDRGYFVKVIDRVAETAI